MPNHVVNLPLNRWVDFPVHGTRIMPSVPAIYALYRGTSLVYIGQTVNLRARFSTAYRRRADLTVAKIKVVSDPTTLDHLERRLIRRLKPVDNRTFTGRYRGRLYRRMTYNEVEH